MAKKAKKSKKSGSDSKVEELRKRMKKNAPSLKDIQEQNDKDDSVVGANNRSEYLEFEDGKTIRLRFLPPHNPDVKNFYFLRKRYWLPIEKEDGDIGRTVVLDSILHGGTKMDIVDEYIKMGKKIHKNNPDKVKKLTDSYGGGLAAEHMWLSYVLKIKGDVREFGIIAFKKSVRDAINKINFVEEDDQPIETIDTFTGEGYALLVKYLSKPNRKKGQDYYTCNLSKSVVDLEDDEILKWGDAKPLDEMYEKVYNMGDFERALEGLQVFDEANDVGVFDEERWEEIVEQVKLQYEDNDEEDDEDEEEEEKPKSKKKSKKKPEPEPEDDDEDEDDDDEDEDDDEDDDDEDDEDEDDDDDDDDDDEDEDDEDDDEDDDDDDESESLKRIKQKLKRSKK